MGRSGFLGLHDDTLTLGLGLGDIPHESSIGLDVSQIC